MVVNSDIPGLLCDAINNHHPQIIRGVFACLWELSKNEEFYVQKHSTIVVETICRTLGILSKNENTLKIILYGIEIINRILAKSDKETTINLAQVVVLSRDLLFNNIYQKVHVNVIRVLRTILRIEDFFHADLLPTGYRAIQLFGKLYKNNRKKFIENITLLCDIMVCSLRYVDLRALQHPVQHGGQGLEMTNEEPQVDGRHRQCTLEKNGHYSNKLMEIILSLLQLSIVPFIQKVKLNKCHAGFISRLLSCVLTVCMALDPKRLKRLCNSLASKDFLTILPAINVHFNEQSIHSCVMTLLSHVVITLAVAYLQPSRTECQLITAGICSLPTDFSTWPQLLIQQRSHKAHCAIIAYLYFVMLCAGSFTNNQAYLPVLCSYLQVQTSIPSPAILKAVWLIFAGLTLSETEWSQQVQSANSVLMSWLRTAPLLDRVYTRHPALLLWVFSPLLTNKILQINLEVLSCCSQDLTPMLFPMLKTVVARDKVEGHSDMSHFMWSNLPITLGVITSPHPYPQSRVPNVCCLVSLACSLVPARLGGLLLLRTGLELLRALRRHPSTHPARILQAQLFKLANIIVIKSYHAQDYRALELFLQNTVLLKALIACLDCEDKWGTLPALRLLTCLQYYHKILSNAKLVHSGYIGGVSLLQLMTCSRSKTVLAMLQLFTVLLKSCTGTFSPLVTLPPSTPASILQALYLEFQNITLKTNNGWKCQRLLIEFCSIHNSQVEQHLLIQPWTYTLIQLTLQNNGLQDLDVSQFLRLWLQRCRLVQQYSARRRALPRDRLADTISQIALALLHLQYRDSVHADIGLKVCSFGAFISPQTLRSLREKLLYL